MHPHHHHHRQLLLTLPQPHRPPRPAQQLLLPKTPPMLKKLLQYRPALLRPHPLNNLNLMIQPLVLKSLVKAAHRPALGVANPKNHPRNTTQYYRPRTHQTRLKRHIQRRLSQPPVPQSLRRLSYGNNLRMCSRIMQQLPLIMRPPNHPPLAHNNTPNRHLIHIKTPAPPLSKPNP